jgi:hypothetical protein
MLRSSDVQRSMPNARRWVARCSQRKPQRLEARALFGGEHEVATVYAVVGAVCRQDFGRARRLMKLRRFVSRFFLWFRLLAVPALAPSERPCLDLDGHPMGLQANVDRAPDPDPGMTRWIDVPSLLSWLYVRVVPWVAWGWNHIPVATRVGIWNRGVYPGIARSWWFDHLLRRTPLLCGRRKAILANRGI